MIGQLVSQLAAVHCALWHEEDRARANDYAEAQPAKREIDRLNQQRNDLVQQIDEAVARG